jgi:hypothetical protein
VLHHQTHDAAQAEVGGLWLMSRGRRGPRSWPPNCACPDDAVSMREVEQNNNLLSSAMEVS